MKCTICKKRKATKVVRDGMDKLVDVCHKCRNKTINQR